MYRRFFLSRQLVAGLLIALSTVAIVNPARAADPVSAELVRTGGPQSFVMATSAIYTPLGGGVHKFENMGRLMMQFASNGPPPLGVYNQAPPVLGKFSFTFVRTDATCAGTSAAVLDIRQLVVLNSQIFSMIAIATATCDGIETMKAMFGYYTQQPFHWITFNKINNSIGIIGLQATETIEITPKGGGVITLRPATITGPDAAHYTIVSDGCGNRQLLADEKCRVAYTYMPTFPGTTAQLNVVGINSTSFGEPFDISQSGVNMPPPTPLPNNGSVLHPVKPTRLLDTRAAIGVPGSGPLGNVPITVQITGRDSIPASATGVIVNLTVTAPTKVGYVTIWPAGETMPVVSNINFVPGDTIANMSTLALSTTGALNVFNNAGTTHVIVDVVAWLGNDPPGSPDALMGLVYRPVTPTRMWDTRPKSGFGGGPLLPGESRTFPVSIMNGTPSGAVAVLANITAVTPTAETFLTAFTPFDPVPKTSTLNVKAGETRANLAIIDMFAGGISLANSNGKTNVVIDVLGYFVRLQSSDNQISGRIMLVSPFRYSDSRGTKDRFEPMDYNGYGIDKQFDDRLRVGGLIFNATVTNAGSAGYMTMFPWDVGQIPYVSTSNFIAGQTVANQSWVRLANAPSNYVGIWNGSAGRFDVILDVQAVFLE
jgi:hypothetical protein